MRGNKDHQLVNAVRKLVERQLKAGRSHDEIHMDLQRAFVEGTVNVSRRIEEPDYPMHASGKPRLWWQQGSKTVQH